MLTAVRADTWSMNRNRQPTTPRSFWNGHPDGRARVWVHDRWWLETVATPHGEPPAGEHPDDDTTTTEDRP